MKKNLFIIASALMAIQIASANALTALCSTSSEENGTSVLKVVVADDWKAAIVTSADADGISQALNLSCNGQTQVNQEFKCEVRMNFPDMGHIAMTFLRDVHNQMTLVAEAESPLCDTEEMNLDIQKFDCIKI